MPGDRAGFREKATGKREKGKGERLPRVVEAAALAARLILKLYALPGGRRIAAPTQPSHL